MTISTTQWTTRLRTWALVAGLTGLMIAVGALIGGAFLWLFVAIAVALQPRGLLLFRPDRAARGPRPSTATRRCARDP